MLEEEEEAPMAQVIPGLSGEPSAMCSAEGAMGSTVGSAEGAMGGAEGLGCGAEGHCSSSGSSTITPQRSLQSDPNNPLLRKAQSDMTNIQLRQSTMKSPTRQVRMYGSMTAFQIKY